MCQKSPLPQLRAAAVQLLKSRHSLIADKLKALVGLGLTFPPVRYPLIEGYYIYVPGDESFAISIAASNTA